MINSTRFLKNVRHLINPDYFSADEQWSICHVIFGFFDKYDNAPRDYIDSEVNKYALRTKMGAEKKELLKLLLAKIRNQIGDERYITDQIIEFAKHQSLRIALEEFLPDYERGVYDLNSLIDSFEEVRRIGVDRSDQGHFYFDGLQERVTRRRQRNKYAPIASLIERLDRRYVGILPGQLATIMAPSGVGKSWMMNHLGKAALIQGRVVFHYTLEMSAEEVCDRYDQMLIGEDVDSLNENSSIVKLEKGTLRLKAWGGELVVKYVESGTRVSGLQAHLDLLRDEKNLKPDLILIDFGELFEASKNFKGNEYLRQSDIWRELKSLAVAEEAAVYVATQTSRQGVGAERVSELETSDSFRKFQLSDIMIGFNRNAIYNRKKQEWITIDEDFDQRTVRLFMIKHRGRKDKYSVRFCCNLDRGQFYSSRLTAEINDVEQEKKKEKSSEDVKSKRVRRTT